MSGALDHLHREFGACGYGGMRGVEVAAGAMVCCGGVSVHDGHEGAFGESSEAGSVGSAGRGPEGLADAVEPGFAGIPDGNVPAAALCIDLRMHERLRPRAFGQRLPTSPELQGYWGLLRERKILRNAPLLRSLMGMRGRGTAPRC